VRPGAAIDDLIASTSRLTLGKTPLSDRIIEAITTDWGAECGVHRPTLMNGQWSFDILTTTPGLEALRQASLAMAKESKRPWNFNPLHIDREWRNHVVRARDVPEVLGDRPTAAPLVREHYGRLGLFAYDNLRVNVCDGPLHLLYIGAWRVETFTARERRSFVRLVKELRRALILERVLGGAPASLDALVDALEMNVVPAFVVDDRGSIQVANALGAQILEANLVPTLRRVELALDDTSLRRSDAAVLDIASAFGARPYRVVMFRPPTDRAAVDSGAVERRLRSVARLWGLSPRRTEVLRLLLRGLANKEIATMLEIAEVTVEMHLTRLFRRAGVQTRLELAAAFWKLDL